MSGGSFYIGLSGLNSNLFGIRNVGNNLANTNTIGYKATNVFFEELRSASGDVHSDLSGHGVTPSYIQQVWSQGNLQQSQASTDMAIKGSGFFVVSDGSNSRFFTRAGSFQISQEGKLVTPGGHLVMGYPSINGVINTNTELTPLDLSPGQLLKAQPTSLVRFSTNLNSDAAVGDTFATSMSVYDSLGTSHPITVKFTKTAAGWDYDISVQATSVGGAATDPPISVKTGTFTFDGNGELTSPTADITGITIGGLSNGASDITFDWKLFNENGESYLSQYNLPNSTSETYQDGKGAGVLTGVLVRPNGTIEGLFSNGETSALGQVALAGFTNPQGLVRVGDNLYARTTQSGDPTIGEPDTGGRGSIVGNAVEVSNVDIAEEFIKLIVFQRGYQANSRMITTSDQVTMEALQLKQ